MSYALASLGPARATAKQLAAPLRRRWEINDRLHNVRDFTCYKHRSRLYVRDLQTVAGKAGGGARKAWLVGNREYRRYLQQRGQGFELDEAKIAGEERYDGLWALRVRADVSASAAVRKYKELWRVERCFREAKSLLRTRPVYHRTDEAIRRQIFCSFLALVLKQELQARKQAAGIEAEWADLIRDLGRLSETEVELQGKRFAVRTQAQGAVAQIVRCAGASLPLVIRQCGGSAREAKPEVSKAA